MTKTTNQTTINCPYCAETIKANAKKCPHCNEVLDAQMREIEALKKDKASSNVFMNAGGGGGASSGSNLRPFGHMKHIIISIFTSGLWLPVYLFVYIFRNKSVYY